MVIASRRNNSGDEPLLTRIIPIVLIFLLFLGMFSAVAYAIDNEDGGNRNGGNGIGGDHGNKSGSDRGNWNGGDGDNTNGNPGDGSNRKEVDTANGPRADRGNGKDNVQDKNVSRGYDQKRTSEIGTSGLGSKTAVVQHTVSAHAQAPLVVLLVTYSVETTSSVSAAWWSLVESNAEGLFRKFFFLAGSVGDKIRRKKVLENRKRREIYCFIVNNPFSHFRRITRMAGVGPNEGSWHLRILEKMGLITSEHVGRYLTYRANNCGHIGSRDNQPVCFILNSNAIKILMYLLRNPGVKIAHLTHALMINRNTISYHIKRMQTNGLVERVGKKGLRLSPVVEDYGPELVDFTASPVASGNLQMHRKLTSHLS